MTNPPSTNNSGDESEPRKPAAKRPTLLAASAALFLIGIVLTAFIALRLAKHQREHGRTIYAFAPVTETDFQYAGHPVTLTKVPESEANPLGSVRLQYGDESVDLVVPFQRRAYTQDLPGLVEYEDWLRVLRFAPLSGHTGEQLVTGIDSGEIQDRLCVVVRIPRQGVDAQTWGRVWKRDWTFAIYELLPDGSIRSERWAYPQGRPYDENPPEQVGGLPVLKPDTWQHDAALYVMPVGSGPKIRIIDSALRDVGWPFGGAIVAFSLATALAVLGLMPSRSDIDRRVEQQG